MLSKVFSCVLLTLLLINVEFSSQTIIESKCNDKCEPTKYTVLNPDEENLLIAVFQMESTDAFEPILSLELIDPRAFYSINTFNDFLVFELKDKEYRFNCIRHFKYAEPFCNSGFYGIEKTSNCSITRESCKWLIKVGMNPLIYNEGYLDTSSIDMITQPNRSVIGLASSFRYQEVAQDLTDLPIYRFSYVRCCENNKKIYDIDGDMITLKKEKDSFQLFFYRLFKRKVMKPRKITLVNSKNNSLEVFCADDRNDIFAYTKTSVLRDGVKDEYIFRKHIDFLRCGVSLALEMKNGYSSFSFNDTPLKLIYENNGSDDIVHEVKFESDSNATDEPKIEATSAASVDQEVVTENQKKGKVERVIGFFSDIISRVKNWYHNW